MGEYCKYWPKQRRYYHDEIPEPYMIAHYKVFHEGLEEIGKVNIAKLRQEEADKEKFGYKYYNESFRTELFERRRYDKLHGTNTEDELLLSDEAREKLK